MPTDAGRLSGEEGHAMGGIPLGQWSGSGATNALREIIERFNARTSLNNLWLQS
jgi:hypothetical protein